MYLEVYFAAKQSNCKALHCAGFVRMILPVARLHDMVICEPLNTRVASPVDRCRMDRDRLVVHHVPPAFAFSRRQLGIETPRDHRVDDNVLAAIVV